MIFNVTKRNIKFFIHKIIQRMNEPRIPKKIGQDMGVLLFKNDNK